jgi:uncharacterized metal-binding protein YceD (DUF177 family)
MTEMIAVTLDRLRQLEAVATGEITAVQQMPCNRCLPLHRARSKLPP